MSIHCEQVVNFIIPSQLSKNMICVNNIFAYEKNHLVFALVVGRQQKFSK